MYISLSQKKEFHKDNFLFFFILENCDQNLSESVAKLFEYQMTEFDSFNYDHIN